VQTAEPGRLLSLARTAVAGPHCAGRRLLSAEEPTGKWAHYTARELADRAAVTAWFARDSGGSAGPNRWASRRRASPSRT